jgi:hypothetical protein
MVGAGAGLCGGDYESVTLELGTLSRLTSWTISESYVAKYALYFNSSTKYAHPWLNPGSVLLFDTRLRVRRKLASIPKKSR